MNGMIATAAAIEVPNTTPLDLAAEIMSANAFGLWL